MARVRTGRRGKTPKREAELDITSFMNLMIVLVPVLLMMMVFSRITVLDLTLPALGEASELPIEIKDQRLEIVVRANNIAVYYPQGYLVKDLPVTEQVYDYQGLQTILQQIKQTLLSQDIDKKAATLLLEENIPYQVIVALMDTTRSYPDVVVASVVEAELFPEISLGDAPVDERELSPKEAVNAPSPSTAAKAGE
jgi:biopolymer transport protein ExbD